VNNRKNQIAKLELALKKNLKKRKKFIKNRQEKKIKDEYIK
jgi:hypothetical protein